MLRSTASKVMWVGRATVFLVGLAVILALTVGVATTALGANGQSFLLGRFNAATALTKLTGNVNGAAMQVVNSNAGANDTALSLSVQSGEAPMRVNSNTRVANLNAARAGRADSAASADNATNAQNAANAGRLDNLDSSNLLPGGTLPAGTTLRGTYEFDGYATADNQIVGGDSISFGFTLPSTPSVKFIPEGTTPPAECPGTTTLPQASPGFLCIYEYARTNIKSGDPFVYNYSRVGASLVGYSAVTGGAYSGGRWAVTVPTSAQAQTLAQKDGGDDASQGRRDP